MPIRTRVPARPPAHFSWVGAMAGVYFALLLILLGLSAFLWKSGDLLVRVDPPGHVRWAAVLAGEGRDLERSEAAWVLYQEGAFDSLILMGPRVFKSRYASEFSAAYLESRGFPKDRLFQLPNEALSTLQEAAILIPQARLLGADTLLLITTSFHSARAGRVFRRLAGGYPAIRVHAAEAFAFDPKAWWSFGESREVWLIEWIKTLHTGWRLLRQKPLAGSGEFMLLEPNPRAGEMHREDSAKISPVEIPVVVQEPVKDSVQAEKPDTVESAPVDSGKTAGDTAVKAQDSAVKSAGKAKKE